MTRNQPQLRSREIARHLGARNSKPGRSAINRNPMLLEFLVRALAKGLRSVHYVIGITTLSSEATQDEERSFVLLWAGMLVFIALFLQFWFTS